MNTPTLEASCQSAASCPSTLAGLPLTIVPVQSRTTLKCALTLLSVSEPEVTSTLMLENLSEVALLVTGVISEAPKRIPVATTSVAGSRASANVQSKPLMPLFPPGEATHKNRLFDAARLEGEH